MALLDPGTHGFLFSSIVSEMKDKMVMKERLADLLVQKICPIGALRSPANVSRIHCSLCIRVCLQGMHLLYVCNGYAGDSVCMCVG